MSDPSDDVFQRAMSLSLEQRAELAAQLLRSLDEGDQAPSQQEVDRAWAEEITRRADRAIRGESVGRDAREVMRSIEAKLRRP